MGKTLATLAFFIVVGLLPKVPWWVKVFIQLIVGAIIYFAMPDGEFPLPAPDTNPIGAELYGGNAAKAWGFDDAPAFAYLSVGVLFTVLGLLSTAFFTILSLVFAKGKDKA